MKLIKFEDEGNEFYINPEHVTSIYVSPKHGETVICMTGDKICSLSANIKVVAEKLGYKEWE